MNFLKTAWKWILVGLIFIGGLLALLNPKERKWQKKAISNEESHLKDAAEDANEAFADSDEHNAAAAKIIAEGKSEAKEVKDSEESMGDLLKRLRS